MPVAWRAPVREDDRVLVLGATGTVGLVAVQAAKLLGAKHVVAAGRNPERLERAAELGADATVSLDEDDLVAAFKEAAGGDGPTYIVDTLWGPPAVAAIQAATRGWRLIQIGQSAGGEVPVPSAAIRGKMGELYGFTDYAVPPDTFREHYARLVGHAAAGEIVFDIETYPFDKVARGMGEAGGRGQREDRRHGCVRCHGRRACYLTGTRGAAAPVCGNMGGKRGEGGLSDENAWLRGRRQMHVRVQPEMDCGRSCLNHR